MRHKHRKILLAPKKDSPRKRKKKLDTKKGKGDEGIVSAADAATEVNVPSSEPAVRTGSNVIQLNAHEHDQIHSLVTDFAAELPDEDGNMEAQGSECELFKMDATKLNGNGESNSKTKPIILLKECNDELRTPPKHELINDNGNNEPDQGSDRENANTGIVEKLKVESDLMDVAEFDQILPEVVDMGVSNDDNDSLYNDQPDDHRDEVHTGNNAPEAEGRDKDGDAAAVKCSDDDDCLNSATPELGKTSNLDKVIGKEKRESPDCPVSSGRSAKHKARLQIALSRGGEG